MARIDEDKISCSRNASAQAVVKELITVPVAVQANIRPYFRSTGKQPTYIHAY
jgi:hypothetical protein